MLRTGEVRVNSGRVKQDYRLCTDDIVRLPPTYHEDAPTREFKPSELQVKTLKKSIIYEDDFVMVMNKPGGLPVHAGTGEKYGLIEILRSIYTNLEFLELVHRLDKQTSGCLVLAKDHRVLRNLHTQFNQHKVSKNYQALVKGRLMKQRQAKSALKKNELESGERMVQESRDGKESISIFSPLKIFNEATLANVDIKTGRTHQIRVHSASIGHPVAGDDKYGDRNFNKTMKRFGLKRMYLHAETLSFMLPNEKRPRTFHAKLPEDLERVLLKLEKASG